MIWLGEMHCATFFAAFTILSMILVRSITLCFNETYSLTVEALASTC